MRRASARRPARRSAEAHVGEQRGVRERIEPDAPHLVGELALHAERFEQRDELSRAGARRAARCQEAPHHRKPRAVVGGGLVPLLEDADRVALVADQRAPIAASSSGAPRAAHRLAAQQRRRVGLAGALQLARDSTRVEPSSCAHRAPARAARADRSTSAARTARLASTYTSQAWPRSSRSRQTPRRSGMGSWHVAEHLRARSVARRRQLDQLLDPTRA